MPTPDIPSRPRRRDVGGRLFTPGFAHLPWVEVRKPKPRRPGKRGQDGRILVEPDRPRDLSGGAAEPLVFEND